MAKLQALGVTLVHFRCIPLKNLNVWSDGGVIITNDKKIADDLRILRNHGLAGRDIVTKL